MPLPLVKVPIEDVSVRSSSLFPAAEAYVSARRALTDPPLRYLQPLEHCHTTIGAAISVPETAGLLIGPHGCLRRTSFSRIKYGLEGRLYLLPVSEPDVVMARQLELIAQAVEKIAEELTPRAIIVCLTCIDSLLGTDIEALARELERSLGIPVRGVAVFPNCLDRSPPVLKEVYSCIHSLLPEAAKREPAVGLLGAYSPLEKGGELHDVLTRAGFQLPRQLPSCNTFDEFCSMASVSYNLLLHPRAIIWAERMARGVGVPYCSVPVVYGFAKIETNYARIESMLKTPVDVRSYRRAAEEAIVPLLKTLRGRRIAVGCWANGCPFEIARTLVDHGLDVRALFIRNVDRQAEQDLCWLKRNAPHLTVYNGSHPALMEYLEEWEDIDIAVGSDAAYCCTNAASVPMSLYQHGFGYQNARRLVEEMAAAVTGPRGPDGAAGIPNARELARDL